MRVRSSIGRPQAARAMPGPVPRPQRASSAASVRGPLLVLLPVLLLVPTRIPALATSPSPSAGTGRSTTASPAACPAQGPALLLLAADDGVHGTEPWVSDGTPEGTRLLADIDPGSASSEPDAIAALEGLLVLAADDGVHGPEPWVTDGTPGGTRLLADTRPEPGRGLPGRRRVSWARAGQRLLLALPGRAGTTTLWSTDGTPEGTVRPLPDEGPFAIIGPTSGTGPAFVLSGDVLAGWRLWRSDGTSEGTRPLMGFAPTIEPSEEDWDGYPDDAPRLLALLGDGTLLFAARANELWRTDGTPEGTRLVTDLGPTGDPHPRPLAQLDGRRLLFHAPHRPGETAPPLWASDGTAEGTGSLGRIRQVTSYATTPAEDDQPLAVLDGTAVLFAEDDRGKALWATDGTPDGTRRLRSLWRGYVDVARGGVVVDGRLYFAARGPRGLDLWRTDGTADGTIPLTDLPAHASIVDIATFGRRVLFTVRQGDRSIQLWAAGGPREGARLLETYPADPPSWLTGVFLPATARGVTFVHTLRATSTGRRGFEETGGVFGLSVSDGTARGTTRLEGPESHVVGQGPENLRPQAAQVRQMFVAAPVEDQLFVGSWDSGLWLTDGSGAGTRQLSTVVPAWMWAPAPSPSAC